MCVCVRPKVKEQEDVSSQIHTIAQDSRIIYYDRDEYWETEWGRNCGSGSVLHTLTHTHK